MATKPIERDLLALEKRYWQAIKDKDADTAASLSDEPCIVTGPQGVRHIDKATLAEMMKSAGYATFFGGKWHMGPEGWWPEDQGYDINLGGIDKGGPYGGKKYFSPYDNPRLPDGPEGEHLPDRLAGETAKFIEANQGRPFFAFFSFYDVHTPLMARQDLEDVARSYDGSGPIGTNPRTVTGSGQLLDILLSAA